MDTIVNIETVSKQIEQSNLFKDALNKIDTTLITKADKLLKETYPYVSGTKTCQEDLRLLFEEQFLYVLDTIYYQIDISGLSNAIAILIPDVLENFDFSSDEFLKIEFEATKDYGLTKSDLVQSFKLAEEYKHKLFEKYKEIATSQDTSGIKFTTLFETYRIQTSRKDVMAAGAYLGGVNLVLLCAPEPISSGVGAASLLTGFVCTFFS